MREMALITTFIVYCAYANRAICDKALCCGYHKLYCLSAKFV